MRVKKGNQRLRPTAVRGDSRAMPEGARLVIGRNAVEAVLADQSSQILRLLVAADEKGRARQLLDLAEKRGVQIEFCSKGALSQRSSSDSHQGFIAIVQAQRLGSRQDLLVALEGRDRFLLVAMDAVTDPHNLGAILRACECFGVDGVVWSKNRTPGITPAVTKVAVGATELLPLYEVSNLADTLLAIEKEFGASILCADGDSLGTELSDFHAPERSVLVLGNEGDGVSDLIKRRATTLLRIPMYGQIDSLNVSQAAAVLLYALKLSIK